MDQKLELSELRAGLRRRRQDAFNHAADAHILAADTHERAAALYEKLHDAERAAQHREASRRDRMRADEARAAAMRQ